jgi:hypothetical protein
MNEYLNINNNLTTTSYMLLDNEDLEKNMKEFKFKSIFITIIYILTTLFNFFTNNTNYLNLSLIPKLLANIIAYYTNEVYIDTYFHMYNEYIVNLFKYISIFIFQNIIYKLFFPTYNIFLIANIIKTLLYLFMYSSLDLINDIVFENKYDNTIIRIILSFIIVETLTKNEINYDDYLNLFFFILSYIIYTLIIHKQINKFIDL